MSSSRFGPALGIPRAVAIVAAWCMLGGPGCKEEDDLYDFDGDGVVDADDCDPDDPLIYPGALDPCDGVDRDCDGFDCDDGDHDGFTTDDGDCDDNDAAVNPGVPEVPCDTLDNDCEPGTADQPDGDGDGYSTCPGDGMDCDDGDALVNPGAEEHCGNGVDDDCDESNNDQCGFSSPFSMAAADAILSGEESYHLAGWALTGGMDFSGDEVNDLFVGAVGMFGHVYVVDGQTTGLADLSASRTILAGEEMNSGLGAALAVAEDMTGDGLADLVVGSPWISGEEVSSGAVYVISDPQPGYHSVGDVAAARMNGIGPQDEMGSAVAAAGDVSHDGMQDLLIGVPGYNGYAGVVYLFYSPINGELVVENAAAEFHDSCGGSHVGSALMPGGDHNNDGTVDFFISAPYWEGYGGVFLMSGTQTGSVLLEPATTLATLETGGVSLGGFLDVGDQDGDGDLDLFAASWDVDRVAQAFVERGPLVGTTDMDQYADITLLGHDLIPDDADHGHDGDVAIVGDTQANSAADLLLGVPYDTAGDDAGAAYLMLDVGDGQTPLTEGVQFVGRHEASLAGWAVTALGKVNEDEYDDFAISSPYYSTDETYQGEVYLFHGRPGI